MTRIWVGDKQVPATLVKLCDQEIIRYKTPEKDGYSAMVVGVGKQITNKKKGQKVKWNLVTEFLVDPSFAEQYPVGSSFTAADLADVSSLRVVARSKGKGFQGVMKRHNFAGGPETHGSKFHRA
jgi:large subunit ribosomal protein L3